ncbi:unnamed protein product [Gadus morhua 'NCC']
MRLDEGVDIPVNLPLSVSVAAKVISESELDSLRSAIPPLCISCFPALCTRSDPGNKRPGVNQKHCAATMGLPATALWTDTNTNLGGPLLALTHTREWLPSPDPFSLLPPHSAMKTLLSPLSSSGLTLTSDLSTGSLTPLAPWWSDSVLTEPTVVFRAQVNAP